MTAHIPVLESPRPNKWSQFETMQLVQMVNKHLDIPDPFVLTCDREELIEMLDDVGEELKQQRKDCA
jgi:hypothetical protein